MFAGFAELLNQPGFGAIAQTALAAVNAYPERALAITQLALADFEFARKTVLASHVHSTEAKTISPSAALLALAHSSATKIPDLTAISTPQLTANPQAMVEDTQETIPSFEDVSSSTEFDVTPPGTKVSDDTHNVETDGRLGQRRQDPQLSKILVAMLTSRSNDVSGFTRRLSSC